MRDLRCVTIDSILDSPVYPQETGEVVNESSRNALEFLGIPAALTGLGAHAGTGIAYCERCRFASSVPICWKVVTICDAEVNMKNLLESVAQFCSTVEVGSPSVLTWIE
jgi:hypothetical protein